MVEEKKVKKATAKPVEEVKTETAVVKKDKPEVPKKVRPIGFVG